MNKIIILIIALSILNNCSLNENSRIWKEKEKKLKNEINTKKIFKWKRMDKNKLYILLEKENFLNPIAVN